MNFGWQERDALVAQAVASAGGLGGARLYLHCPLCPVVKGSANRKRSMVFNRATGSYKCYRCDSYGRLRDLFARFEPNADSAALEELLRCEAGQPPYGFYFLATEPARSSMMIAAPVHYLTKPQAEGGRGWPEELLWSRCEEAQIGACFAGPMNGRVVVPITAPDGAWLGWVSRCWFSRPAWVADSEWKPYLYPPGSWRSGVFYNEKALDIETDEPCAVVEGAFDSIYVGLDDSVASLGKISGLHLVKLLKARRPIAFVNDGDEWELSERWAMTLRARGKLAGALHLPPKKDPDQIPHQELLAGMRACITTRRSSLALG